MYPVLLFKVAISMSTTLILGRINLSYVIKQLRYFVPTSSCHHDLAHTGMLTIQLLPTITKWMFDHEDGLAIYINTVTYRGR